MNRILRSQLVVAGMNTLNKAVPRLPCVFIPVFPNVLNNFAVNHPVRALGRISIVKCGFTLS